MAFPSVTYTFSNSTTADATQVNQNFTDLINGLSDGTKSLNVSAIGAVSTVTATITSNILALSIGTNSTAGAVSISETGILGSNTSALSVSVTGAQTTGQAAVYAELTSASSTIPLFAGQHAGTGDLLKLGTSAADLFRILSTGVLAFGGSVTAGWTSNIGLARATTTNANDSIKITGANGTALSSTNPAYVCLPSNTQGQQQVFRITSDVTVKISGCLWGVTGSGNLTGALIRIYGLNDNGTLRWGFGVQGGYTLIKSAQTSTTQSSVTGSEFFLTDSAVGSNSVCWDFGYFTADFTDSSKVWALQSGNNALVFGRTADGIWQAFNPVYSGFSVVPSGGNHKWMSVGNTAHFSIEPSVTGTSNATTFTLGLPIKAKYQATTGWAYIIDAGSASDGGMQTQASLATINMLLGAGFVSNAWTASNVKIVRGSISFEMYQP